MSYMITCAYCKETKEKDNKVETCSVTCRNRLRTKRRKEAAETKKCPICQEAKLLWRRAQGILVCSNRCANIVHARHWGAENGGARCDIDAPMKLPPDKVKCEICGTVVEGRRWGQKYCSYECKTEAMHKRNRQKRKKKRKNTDKCEICEIAIDAILTPNELGFRAFNPNVRDMKVHFDHIVPRTDGGSNDDENLRNTCWMCNYIRSTMDTKYDPAVAAASRAFWQEIEKIH